MFASLKDKKKFISELNRVTETEVNLSNGSTFVQVGSTLDRVPAFCQPVHPSKSVLEVVFLRPSKGHKT